MKPVLQFLALAVFLVFSVSPTVATTYSYNFETGTLQGWVADAADDSGYPWHITPSRIMASDGSWSLELYMLNYSDATKIWIEKYFFVASTEDYGVRVNWKLACGNSGDMDLSNFIVSVSGSNPETFEDFVNLGNTRNGHQSGYAWLNKSYSAACTPQPAGPMNGVIYVGIGVWGVWESPITHYLDSVTIDINPVQVCSIQDARKLADGTAVRLEDKVLTSCQDDFANRVYIEEPDRNAGIAVDTSRVNLTNWRGDIVTVVGMLMTVDGERVVKASNVILVASNIELKPVFLANSAIGGGPLGQYTPGVAGSCGLNNVGMFVRTFGRIVDQGEGFFVIDDGSRHETCGKCLNNGVAVATTGMASDENPIVIPPKGSYVTVTGIVSCFIDAATGKIFPLIRPLSVEDQNAPTP